MKPGRIELPPTVVVEDAINRVLTAEQEARAAVDECRGKAQAILEAARGRSRQILERGEEYIARARARSDATVEGRLADLKAAAAGLSDVALVDEGRMARVRQLVPALVRELIGGEE
jgi:regulator of protease activity HflC (stomatin/prohibitin superfamily)